MFKKISLAIAAAVVLASTALATVSAASNNLNKLTPFVSCVAVMDVDPTSGFTWYVAYFGYTNSSNKVITVPTGPNNTVTPWSTDGGPTHPTVFQPGTHDKVFRLSMIDRIEWKLGNKVAVATPDSPRCQ